MEAAALDTTFLIDLQRERSGKAANRRATDFLRAHAKVELWLPVIALGEYLEGFADPDLERARAMTRHLRTLDVTPAAARIYAIEARRLRAAGTMIGANDLWIAAIAKANRLPIITRNRQHFGRVSGVTVIEYSLLADA